MRIVDNNTVVLCCGGNKKCPTVIKNLDGTVKITDDDGNSIVVKESELELIPDALTHFKRGGVKEKVDQDNQQLILG